MSTVWREAGQDRAPEAIHRVFRPMHLPPDRSTLRVQCRPPSPGEPDLGRGDDTFSQRQQQEHRSAGGAAPREDPPDSAGRVRARRNTVSGCGVEEAQLSCPSSHQRPLVNPETIVKSHEERGGGVEMDGGDFPRATVGVVERAAAADSPRAHNLPRTFSHGDTVGIGRQGSLTQEWLQNNLVQSPSKRRQPAGKSSLMPSEAQPIEFPTLPMAMPAGVEAGVPLIAPALPPLELSPIKPTSSPARRASSFNLARQTSDGSDELNLSYQSSVDMPFDISLNSTILLDESFSFGAMDYYSRPRLEEMLATTHIDFPSDASPLARQPPLVEVTPLWHSIPDSQTTGVADRLHSIKSLKPDIGQRLRALELENRLLRERLAGTASQSDGQSR